MGRLENAMRRAAGEPTATSTIDEPFEQALEVLPSEASPEATATIAARRDEPSGVDEQAPPSTEGAQAMSTTQPGDDLSEKMLRHQLSAALATKTVVDDTMMPASREQYRRLAAALHQAQRTSQFKVVMVVSAVAGEGKTLTASNLAMTLSESYRRDVLLVDADLRRPSLHAVFQVPGAPGLSDGLISLEAPKLPLHRVSDRLAVLPAGRPTSDPIGALTSDRMRRLLAEAREVFDWVVIDTPPVGLLTDAALLASMADGVVLVVKAESTPYEMVQRAVTAIGRDRVLGTVLNRALEQASRSNYDYYKYYTQAEPPKALPR